jgi:uncharacterized membrane protein YozB (DUF420 family)
VFDGVRLEYVDAVNAVRNGVTQRLIFIPSILIWIAVVRGRHLFILIAITFATTWWLCCVHARHVQSAKERYAVTEIEIKDRDFDVAYRYAPISALIYTTLLCGTNVSVSVVAVFIVRRMLTRAADAQNKIAT